MKQLIGVIFIIFVVPMSVQANDRYQQMQKWLRAHEAEQRQAEQDEAKVEKKRLERIEKCARAKDYSTRYERSTRIYSFDEKGERHYLNDEERAHEEQRMANAVERWCN